MRILIIYIIFIFFISVPITSAEAEDLFIDHLTEIIYGDCYCKDIQINNFINSSTGEPYVRTFKWPYTEQVVRDIVTFFGNNEPFALYQGSCENKSVSLPGPIGCGILTCGDNRLDINQFTYIWNGMRVAVPREEYKMALGPNSTIVDIETHGDNSPATVGNNNSIFQIQFLSKETLIGTIIGLLLAKCCGFLIRKYRH